MNALAAQLIGRIESAGPMSLADYMTECLLHPVHGYYTTATPFGAGGDFTTAPEISQMFGELVGLMLAQSWMDQGAPSPFTLTEPGPGRGTLMADIWRATARVPGFHAAARLHLIEASPRLRAEQAAQLADAGPVWCDSFAALPDGPLWLIANEFFDALPIRQFQRAGEGWRERVVGLKGGALTLGLSDPMAIGALPARFAQVPEGGIVELRPSARPVMAEIDARIGTHGGAAVIVDYGDWRSRGDTFQAVAKHGFADPFADPGCADLTAHVDFEALALDAPGLRASALIGQGALLQHLGIEARAARLAHNLRGPALEAHEAGFLRLTDPSEMGTLFKALALVPPGQPLPPGFEERS